jgi:serine/threonine-protein kinase
MSSRKMPQTSTDILFDKFEVVDTLKKDSHTSVYLANHIYLGKKIILKTLNTNELADKTILERFKREAQILARLDHPNLIKVLDFGTYANHFYISFEYFESKNLRTIIQHNNLSNESKTNLVIQLLKALNIAHQNQIVHRDIKPENILVNTNLQLKIVDFGLALVQNEHILTQKSSIVGTPGYMSPEQIRGENLTPLTDLFSAGIVIYELFTNINPFIGREISQTINNILNFNEEKDLEKLSSLPENAREAVKNMLRKNFSKRTKSALEALNYFGIQGKIYNPVEQESGIRFKKIKKSLLYSSAAVVLILALIGLWINENLNQNNENNFLQNQKSKNENVYPDKPQINQNEIKTDKDNSSVNELKESTNDSNLKNDAGTEISSGRLFVEVNPWAEVFLDNKKVDTTPLKNYIRLEQGEHELKLIHPDYPPYVSMVNIEPDEIKNIKINFSDYVGYLDCKIYPWGDIYINGGYKTTTPVREPIPLSPGKYTLLIKNPGFNDIEKQIIITAKETISLRLNFEDQKK